MAKGKYQEWLKEEKLILIEGWARDGLTMEQIAHNMGVNQETLYRWKKEYPKISKTLKKGREVADYEVENALHKSATGFYYEEGIYRRDKATGEMVEVQRVRKYQPPNTTAQIFWLKNRKPAQWRDKQEIDMLASVTESVQLYLPDNKHSKRD